MVGNTFAAEPADIPPGPPFPPPVVGQRVYDQAGVFGPLTIRQAEETSRAIEARTGAQLVVYTQVVGYLISKEEAESHAVALIDQWGIGRKGFDDGMVILFDLDQTREHGQVQLYAAPGFRAAYLTNEERQRIFEEEMVPRLRSGDLDGALLAALATVDAAATPEHAQTLLRARQLDAVLGLVAAPLATIALLGWAFFSWFRFGRDPEYLDDPSIYMPAPPPELTAAGGAVLMENHPTSRALTTAMLDLASRGEIAFREEAALFRRKVGVVTEPPEAHEAEPDPQIVRNRRRPLSGAERFLLGRLRSLGRDGYVGPSDLSGVAAHARSFEDNLERQLVEGGWYRVGPGAAIRRWRAIGGGEAILGVLGLAVGFNLPSQGTLLVGGAVLVVGVATLAMASVMPARTMNGAMVDAMLAAYRRTLQKTMAQARSLNQVVAEAVLPWLETPDQALVWGVALDLQKDVDRVLSRSVEDLAEGRASSDPSGGAYYLPSWYRAESSGDGPGEGGGGLLSSSAMPNFGGMVAAIRTIGATASSSGGSGGGFGGGGSGGGGGGAGGSF